MAFCAARNAAFNTMKFMLLIFLPNGDAYLNFGGIYANWYGDIWWQKCRAISKSYIGAEDLS